MSKSRVGLGLAVSVLLSAPLIALMYLGDKLADAAFVPYDLFNWITRILPGPLVTFGIDLMIDFLRLLRINVADAAKTAEQIMAILNFLLPALVIGTIYFVIALRGKNKPTLAGGLLAGALFGMPLVGVSIGVGDSSLPAWVNIIWLLALFAGWGLAMGWAASRLYTTQPEQRGSEAPPEEQAEMRQVARLNRRQFLIMLGASSATITVVGSGLAAYLNRLEQARRAAELEASMAHLAEGPEGNQFPNQDDPVSPAPGTRPEYTPLKDHYKVFIELEPTRISGEGWHLPITGLVDTSLMLTLDDLRQNYKHREQYVTIACISGRVGTSLIGTTLWAGASVADVLNDAGLQAGARYLHIISGDGFHETVDLELIRSDPRIMFCYSWDGNPLPNDHGFPLRIWIPDRYGMKQPKWITGVEVTDSYKEGYWVERGWDELAQVKTTSVIDTVAVNAVHESGGQQLVPIGGIAYSGARGISHVEVRMDGGKWQPAQLRAPLSETTWVIWRIDWPFEAGQHTFEVRCLEGDGTSQIEVESKSRPSGATGIDSREATL